MTHSVLVIQYLPFPIIFGDGNDLVQIYIKLYNDSLKFKSENLMTFGSPASNSVNFKINCGTANLLTVFFISGWMEKLVFSMIWLTVIGKFWKTHPEIFPKLQFFRA